MYFLANNEKSLECKRGKSAWSTENKVTRTATRVKNCDKISLSFPEIKTKTIFTQKKKKKKKKRKVAQSM